VGSYDICHEREYNAFRQGAGLLDVSPLFKYDITGPDAAAFLTRVTAGNVTKLKPNRVTYLCWCDDAGHIIDDGTCTRLGTTHYRLTAASPSYHWLLRHAGQFQVEVKDTTESLAALAIQGPTSRDILKQVTDADMDSLKFFGATQARFDGIEGVITRTGYTGDLGYEVWVERSHAIRLWDILMDGGKPRGLVPAGLDALDVCRVEAGFVLQGVDYTSAFEAVIPSQKSTPYELGLGWTVKLKTAVPHVGHTALEAEKKTGPKWAFVGLDISWDALEKLYDGYGLPPNLHSSAWRDAIPVYAGRKQVGRATSGAWSPILKKNLALATVQANHARPGTVLNIEITVEWERKTVPATIVETPFFNPPRKRS
jgi:aminomethyltransferase